MSIGNIDAKYDMPITYDKNHDWDDNCDASYDIQNLSGANED